MSNLDFLGAMFEDPDSRRAEDERRRRALERAEEALSMLPHSHGLRGDRKLLEAIDELFHEVFCETPFGLDYDRFMRELSFTVSPLDTADSSRQKKAWTRFVDEVGVAVAWPVNWGIAQWYAEHEMIGHAVAVYEHLYSKVRRGEIGRGEFRDDLGVILSQLMRLCVDAGLIFRARHLCEIIEDLYEDRAIGFDEYSESALCASELRYREVERTSDSDRSSTEDRLRTERGALWGQLCGRTRRHILDAEFWSSAHWKHVCPSGAPHAWCLAVESEFHCKVFQPNTKRLSEVTGFVAPRPGKTCGLGQIHWLLQSAASNDGVQRILSGFRGAERLWSTETVGKIWVLKDHRNEIAHVCEGGVYSEARCTEFLETVRDADWAYRFLAALQPR